MFAQTTINLIAWFGVQFGINSTSVMALAQGVYLVYAISSLATADIVSPFDSLSGLCNKVIYAYSRI